MAVDRAALLLLLLIVRVAPYHLWLDARGVPTSVESLVALRGPVDAVLTAGDAGADDWYRLQSDDVFLRQSCVGRRVSVAGGRTERKLARNAIEAVVRGGSYGVLLLDEAVDEELLEFALSRAQHCRGISGVDVSVVQVARAPDDVLACARATDRLGTDAAPPRLCIAADADDASWARARDLRLRYRL